MKETGSKKNHGSNRRRRRRKLRKWVVCVFWLVFLSAVTVTLSLTVFFKLTGAQVKGESKYSQEQIVDAAKLPLGENLFLIDLHAIKVNIETTLPDIGEIEVRRKFPSEIAIKDQGYGNMLQLDEGNEFVVIDSKQTVLRKLKSPLENVLLVKGIRLTKKEPYQKAVPANENYFKMLAELKESIDKSSFEGITLITFVSTENIEIIYDSRIKLIVGSLSKIDEKLGKAKYIVTRECKKTDRGVLDLTVEGNAYFRAD